MEPATNELVAAGPEEWVAVNASLVGVLDKLVERELLGSPSAQDLPAPRTAWPDYQSIGSVRPSGRAIGG